MRNVAAKAPLKRRGGGRRILIVLVVLILLIAGGVVFLNVAAQAAVNASATLTVYQPATSTSHNGTDYSPATTVEPVLAWAVAPPLWPIDTVSR